MHRVALREIFPIAEFYCLLCKVSSALLRGAGQVCGQRYQYCTLPSDEEGINHGGYSLMPHVSQNMIRSQPYHKTTVGRGRCVLPLVWLYKKRRVILLLVLLFHLWCSRLLRGKMMHTDIQTHLQAYTSLHQ